MAAKLIAESNKTPWIFKAVDDVLVPKGTTLTLADGRFPLHAYTIKKPESWTLTYPLYGMSEQKKVFVNVLTTACNPEDLRYGCSVFVTADKGGSRRTRRRTNKSLRRRNRSSRRILY